jgi:hypothetical protein
MNIATEYAIRNFPKPKLTVVHSDCGLSQRTEIVANICNRTNDILEYHYGLEFEKVLVPAQSNVDERMPLYFLRPVAEKLNAVIMDGDLKVPLLPVPTNIMDYHYFVPWTRQIAETINKVIDLL